jgi:release factor glutamine methyltransferase
MAAPPESWTILEILRWTTDYFHTKRVSEPRASAEVLLAHTLGVSRLDLYLRYDQPLNPEELARFKALVVRRREGEPVAYLTGHREFWSLDFHVTPAVLIPRPETETLVAAAVEAAEDKISPKDMGQEEVQPKNENRKPETPPLRGLEVGVGSGAVVVALAKELPRADWVAVDLSEEAIDVARDNARRHGVDGRIHFLRTDLLAGIKPEAVFTVLVANLPYVPRRQWEQLPREIKDFEPRQALLGGEDGLSLIRPLIRQAHRHVKAGGWVLLEVAEGQAPEVVTLLQQTGAYEYVETIKDYSGIERVVRARRQEETG